MKLSLKEQLVGDARERYTAAGYPRAARVRVVWCWDHDTWDEGGRTVACCLVGEKKKEIWLSPRLEDFPRSTQEAIIAHEFGHAVQAFYTGLPKGHDACERGADIIAESVYGKRVFYAPADRYDERLLQTFRESAGSVRPRPAGLR